MDDSRFYPGYVWISESPDCRIGSCYAAATPEQAVIKWAEYRRRYWNRGKVATLYTLASADAEPVRHEVVL